MTNEIADLSRFADSVGSQFQSLLNIPKKRIENLHEHLADIRHRKTLLLAKKESLTRELAEFSNEDNKKEAPLSEEECAKFLPVLSALTLSTVERVCDGNSKWSVRVGKLNCEPEFIEKNWEMVGQALQRITN